MLDLVAQKLHAVFMIIRDFNTKTKLIHIIHAVLKSYLMNFGRPLDSKAVVMYRADWVLSSKEH